MFYSPHCCLWEVEKVDADQMLLFLTRYHMVCPCPVKDPKCVAPATNAYTKISDPHYQEDLWKVFEQSHRVLYLCHARPHGWIFLDALTGSMHHAMHLVFIIAWTSETRIHQFTCIAIQKRSCLQKKKKTILGCSTIPLYNAFFPNTTHCQCGLSSF